MAALVRLGADVALTTSSQGTALHTASDSNRPDAVRWLLEHTTIDPNGLMHGDTTPLYLAAQRGFSKVVQVLVGSPRVNVDFQMPTSTKSKKHWPVVAVGEELARTFFRLN
jgi:hypothetical protein